MNVKKNKYPLLSLIFHILPGAVSIVQVESLNVFMYTHTAIKKSHFYLLLWILLQSGLGVIYARLSDKKLRKKVLVFIQILGIPICIFLMITRHNLLIPVILVAIFNPLPVAKATLLDNFPQYSPLRLIALTYLFQYIPWVMYTIIELLNVDYFLKIQIIILFINSILTYFFVKDEYAIGHKLIEPQVPKNKGKLRNILIAFVSAETAFFLIWAVMEYYPALGPWFSPTTYAALLGIVFAMAYTRITHMSLITLSYFGCFGSMLLALFIFYTMGQGGLIGSIATISVASIFGGMYLPFVTDAAIIHYGGKRKAFAASIVELFDSIAQGIGASIPVLVSWMHIEKITKIPNVFYFMAVFFLIALIFQKFLVKDES